MAGLSTTELGVIGAIVVLALLVAWWIRRRPAERVRAETVDVLTPGAAPAARNALLVDAPPATPPASPDIMAGVGEVFAGAATTAPTAVGPTESGDDLTRIKGLGPKIAGILRGLGVTTFSQIAGWSDVDVARIDPQLGTFQGRIVRDNWVEQAGYLAAGDVAGFEARFGKV
jgi:predicted flap endonuclease-1-like 5' DNA nuclease